MEMSSITHISACFQPPQNYNHQHNLDTKKQAIYFSSHTMKQKWTKSYELCNNLHAKKILKFLIREVITVNHGPRKTFKITLVVLNI